MCGASVSSIEVGGGSRSHSHSSHSSREGRQGVAEATRLPEYRTPHGLTALRTATGKEKSRSRSSRSRPVVVVGCVRVMRVRRPDDEEAAAAAAAAGCVPRSSAHRHRLAAHPFMPTCCPNPLWRCIALVALTQTLMWVVCATPPRAPSRGGLGRRRRRARHRRCVRRDGRRLRRTRPSTAASTTKRRTKTVKKRSEEKQEWCRGRCQHATVLLLALGGESGQSAPDSHTAQCLHCTRHD